MGSNNSRRLQEEEMKIMMKETGFSEEKLNHLFLRFQSLDKKSKGYLTKDDLMQIEALVINPLAERIIETFFRENENLIFQKFVNILATLQRSKSALKIGNDYESLRSKLKFAFSLYDTNGDGKITRDKFREALSVIMGENATEDQLRMVAEQVIVDLSLFTRDITFEDFEKLIMEIVMDKK